ncbi:cytochrome P450 [Martensiomyces pterosporus]|nr:cytochrome P450 [Martensiomyces pterosporus]
MVLSLLTDVDWFDILDRVSAAVNQLGYTNIIATSAGALAAYRVIYALYLSPLRNVPGPFLARLTNKRAELIGILGGQARKAREEYELYGDVYVYQPNAVSISNPTDIRIVLGSHAFQKTVFYHSVNVLNEKTTFSACDPQLASMKRRQIGPYFNSTYLARAEPTIMKQGIHTIKEKWDRLLDRSTSGVAEVNFHKDFLLATFDTIGALAFGRDFGALKNDDSTIVKWMSATLTYFGTHSISPLLNIFPFSLLVWPWERYYNRLIAHSGKCIADRRELLERLGKGATDSEKPADLLQGLIEAEDPESKAKMTPVQVQAESILMLTAGSETSSNTLSTTLHLLMLYPIHYKRAVEEVRSVFGKDHTITYSEAKSKLPFIEACIYESMRVAPVTGGQWPRLAPKGGITLSSGHFIPAGTEINVNLSGANLNKDCWAEPYLFSPTRFVDDEKAKRNVYAFSYGVRVCPGRHLAWMEMLTILANILKDYDFALPPGYTTRGPNVLDVNGYPKLMDSLHFFVTIPENSLRDCRLAISRRS